MGLAASLFCSSDAEKQTLHRRICPSDDQVASQREYWNDLADYLKPDLKERSGWPVTSWIQGSYKFATQIRPARKGLEFDIDLGVYFEWEGDADDGDHSAADLKTMVQESLEAYASDRDTDAKHTTDSKEFCSRIVFSHHFHIDVPAYHESDDVRSLASETDGFVDSDPWAIWNWWTNSFDEAERPRARRMVRYFKMWAALKFNPKNVTPPSSILLTVLTGYASEALSFADYAGDDELFAAIVNEVGGLLDASTTKKVENPVNSSENLNRLGEDYDNFRDELSKLEDVSERALAADTVATTADIWSEAFEHFFPLPEEEELSKSIVAEARSMVPTFVPEIEITVTLPGGKVYVLRNAALNVPKGSILDFRLVNYAAAPSPCLITWRVRNEGLIAEQENDLGHLAGYGESHDGETAEYRGRHYMDLTVTAHGRVVGVRRVPVSVTDVNIVKGVAKRLFRGKRK